MKQYVKLLMTFIEFVILVVEIFPSFLISSFRRVLNVGCNLLGCSPACGV
jgi:hypothetical protein